MQQTIWEKQISASDTILVTWMTGVFNSTNEQPHCCVCFLLTVQSAPGPERWV